MRCEICGKEIEEPCYYEDDDYYNCCNNPECLNYKWWDLLMEDNYDLFVIDGCCYSVAPDDDHGPKGYGGREFHLKNLNNGWITVTRNLWYEGEIPESHRHLLPDTHEFISGDVELIYDNL